MTPIQYSAPIRTFPLRGARFLRTTLDTIWTNTFLIWNRICHTKYKCVTTNMNKISWRVQFGCTTFVILKTFYFLAFIFTFIWTEIHGSERTWPAHQHPVYHSCPKEHLNITSVFYSLFLFSTLITLALPPVICHSSSISGTEAVEGSSIFFISVIMFIIKH